MKNWTQPLISIALAGGVIYGFLVKLIEPKDYLIIASLAIAYWYKTKDKA